MLLVLVLRCTSELRGAKQQTERAEETEEHLGTLLEPGPLGKAWVVVP